MCVTWYPITLLRHYYHLFPLICRHLYRQLHYICLEWKQEDRAILAVSTSPVKLILYPSKDLSVKMIGDVTYPSLRLLPGNNSNDKTAVSMRYARLCLYYRHERGIDLLFSFSAISRLLRMGVESFLYIEMK